MINVYTSAKNIFLPSAAKVRQAELDYCEQKKIPSYKLMQRAGNALWALIQQQFSEAEEFLIITGPGNNGGDGFELAYIASQAGKKVRLRTIYKNTNIKDYINSITGDAAIALKQLLQTEVTIEPFKESDLLQTDLIIDALLGTGIKAPARDEFCQAITAINQSGIKVLSVDVPSGLDADKGCEIGCAIKAQATLSFIGVKPGLVTGEGKVCCGDLYLHQLDVDIQKNAANISKQFPSLESELKLCSQQLLSRGFSSHKGSHGRTLIIGGNLGLGGAAILAARGASRCGSGAVMLITRPQHVSASLAQCPEVMVIGTDSGTDSELGMLALKALKSATTIVVGPGLGDDDWAKFWLKKALVSNLPKVVDADGLRLAKKLSLSLEGCIITPHPGEAVALFEGEEFSSAASIQQNRYRAVTSLQQQTGAIVILKGAGTLVAIPMDNGSIVVKVCKYGNPGMATAGMGDVLAGILGGLLAQGFKKSNAAVIGTLIHSKSADQASGDMPIGLQPSDCMPYIRQIRNQLSGT